MRDSLILFIIFTVFSSQGCASGQIARSKKQSRIQRMPASARADLGRFAWPLKTVQVTSTFGKRGDDRHEGVDLRASIGTPVYAAAAGRVIYSDQRIKGYGKMVVLRHGKDLSTVYAHNSRLMVRKGQIVDKGQRIALSGNTGRSSGPHLHFEVRRGIAAVNPLALMRAPSSGIEKRVAKLPEFKRNVLSRRLASRPTDRRPAARLVQ